MELPVAYAPMASTGSAKSTEKGRVAAKLQCDAFCASKHLPRCKDLQENQFCDVIFFREFATYLTEHAKSKKTDSLFFAGTVVQYLGAVKEFAMERFPENEMWQTHRLDKWYPSLRFAVETKVNRRRLKAGLATSEGSRPIGREILKKLCHSLMLIGDSESMKKRFAIVTTFLAVGRAGEIACSSWNSVSWDYDLENLIMDWKELKTGDTDKMNFFSDASSKLLDFYHSLACYLILGGGNSALTASSDANWIIPDLARNQETAASVMTKYVRTTFESLSDPCLSNSAKEYEGTSLR
jgi:hypothetical protein